MPSNLKNLYIDKRVPQGEIAKLFGVTQVCVGNWLKRSEIPTIPRPKSGPTKKPSLLNIAWAAGFIEGEGSFHHRRGSPNTRVSATQVNKEPVIWLKEFFGGGITYMVRKPPRQNAYRWQLHGCRARGFAMTIYSFLTKKRKNQARKLFYEGSRNKIKKKNS